MIFLATCQKYHQQKYGNLPEIRLASGKSDSESNQLITGASFNSLSDILGV